MLYGFTDKIAVCFDSFRCSRVMKIRSVCQVAEEQNPLMIAQIYQPVVVLKLVLPFFFFDASPGEVLPSPFDTCFLHFLQYGFKVRRIRLKGRDRKSTR